MKKLIIILFFAPFICKAQCTLSVNASDISGTDTILKRFDCIPKDVRAYYYNVSVKIQPTDTIQVTFGGNMDGGLFDPFIRDSLPYTMIPSKVMKIENGDTAYEKIFTGGMDYYGLKIFMVKITKLNAAGLVTIKPEFYK